MELSAVATKVRKSIQAVAVVIEPYDRRLSVDELISICAMSTPSTVGMSFLNFCFWKYVPTIVYMFVAVPLGGYLFEYFLWTCSGYTVFRQFQSGLARSQGGSLPENVQVSLLQKLSSKFAGWLLFHVASLGNNGRKQMFYMTFVNHYFGLSREGIKTLSRYGYATNLTRFDDMRQGSLLKSQHNTRCVMYILCCFDVSLCVFLVVVVKKFI